MSIFIIILLFVLLFPSNVCAYDTFYGTIDMICQQLNQQNLSLLDPDSLYLNKSLVRELQTRTVYQVSDMIFVGDSRVVGMSALGTYHYVGSNGAGYDWFVNDGCYQMYDMILQYPDSDVILCFGVNDVGNIGSYISFYQSLILSYPETRFWILSVNPLNDSLAAANGYYARNYMVTEFNSVMKEAFPDLFLDTCSLLLKTGFGTADGVHYDAGTYLVIQEYTRFLIEENRNAE